MSIIAKAFQNVPVAKWIKDSKLRYTWQLEINGILYDLKLLYSKMSGKKRFAINDNWIDIEVSCKRNITYTFPLEDHVGEIFEWNNHCGLRIDSIDFFDYYYRINSQTKSNKAKENVSIPINSYNEGIRNNQIINQQNERINEVHNEEENKGYTGNVSNQLNDNENFNEEQNFKSLYQIGNNIQNYLGNINQNNQCENDYLEDMENHISNVCFNNPEGNNQNCLMPDNSNHVPNKENRNMLNQNLENRKNYFDNQDNIIKQEDKNNILQEDEKNQKLKKRPLNELLSKVNPPSKQNVFSTNSNSQNENGQKNIPYFVNNNLNQNENMMKFLSNMNSMGRVNYNMRPK